MGSGKRLKHAQNKYGVENFVKEILFVFDTFEKMDAKEAELVTEEFCRQPTNYNIAPGGFGGGFRYINTTGLNLYGKNGQSGYGMENLIDGKVLKQRLISEGKWGEFRENMSV